MIHRKKIKWARKYLYLGAIINKDIDCTEEIKSRIGQARSSFNTMKNALNSRDLSRVARKPGFWGVTCSLFCYMRWKLEAFALWPYRRILRSTRVDSITNDKLLRRMRQQKEALNTVKIGQLQYLGQVMKSERSGLLQVIVQGKIQRREELRETTHFLDELQFCWFIWNSGISQRRRHMSPIISSEGRTIDRSLH